MKDDEKDEDDWSKKKNKCINEKIESNENGRKYIYVYVYVEAKLLSPWKDWHDFQTMNKRRGEEDEVDSEWEMEISRGGICKP